jgi:hypothetical protein
VTPLPSVGPAAGAWSGLDWVDAGRSFPKQPGSGRTTFSARVFGWSRGYVAFTSDGASQADTESSTWSHDGLHWSSGRRLDWSGLDGEVSVVGIVEGPGGLLAIGERSSGTCGGPPTIGALWTSADGASWRRVPLPKDWHGSRVATVDAGSTGYIATGTLSDGATPAAWLSSDGRSWHVTRLTGSTFGTFKVNGATNFAGGYVIAGAVLGPDGCGGAASLTGSLWWSADGNSWARSALPGASSAADASMNVRRIDDRALVAVETASDASGDPLQQAWISLDGHRWSSVAVPSDLVQLRIITDGSHGVIVVDPVENAGPPTITSVDDDLTVTVLDQSGPGPIASDSAVGWTAAVGPTGVLVLSVDGSHLWLGVPSGS